MNETKRYKVIEHNNGGADMWVIWDTLIEKICSHGYQDLALANEIAETMNSNDPHMLKQQTTDLHAQIAALEAENARMKAALEYVATVENQPCFALVGYMRARALVGLGLSATQQEAENLRETLTAPTEAPATSEGEGKPATSQADYENNRSYEA